MYPSKLLARWRQRKNKHHNKLRYKTRAMQMESLEARQLLANLLVTSAADAGAGSLREMIATANSNSQADTITFASGVSTITLTSGELMLSETGAGNKTTITGPVTLNGNNASRLFAVQPGAAAVLDNLTLTKGRSGDGGAILSRGTLTISNSTLVDNESTGGGGAIRIPTGGSVAILNSTLSNNRAAGFGGAIDNASLLTVTNSTITGNRANIDGNGNEFGGGINTLTGSGATTLFNTIVAGNFRGAVPALTDVTAPGDTVTAVGGTAPSNEGAANAIDNATTGKYLNLGKANSGFEVTPARGATVVTGLRLTTANDAPERDPASYKLEGGNSPSGPFTLISEGALALPDARSAVGPTVSFSNSVAYTSYRLTFPTLKNAATANAMQVGEVELLGVTAPAVPAVTDVTAPGDTVTAVGGNAPSGEGADKAIDNATTGKYLNQGGANSGFVVTPARGATVVTGLRLTTANDAVERDPTSYKLEGGNSPSGPFTLISEGALALPDARSAVGPTVSFSDSLVYTSYRLTFPTLKNAGTAIAMQVGEVELLGRAPGSGGINSDDLRGESIKDPSGNNLIGDAATAGGLTNGVKGNLVGNNGSGVRDINTVLDTTLKDNGGGLLTHALVTNSPAIDAGNSASLSSSILVDQRGKPRILGRSIDIGAVERRPGANILLVTSSADAGPGSLREALAIANSNQQADTIEFAPGVSTITLTSGVLVLTETGEGNKTTITGPVTLNGNNATRLLTVNAGAFADLTNLTLTKGNAGIGGAIYNQGTLTISGSTIADNVVRLHGAGLLNAAGAVAKIVNSTFSNNRAGAFGGAIGNDGKLTVTNGTIIGNQADSDGAGGEFGGGITSGGPATVSLFNTIVAGNIRGSGAGTADDVRGNSLTADSRNNLIGDAATAGGLTNGVKGNLVGNNGSGVRDITTVLDTTLKDNGGGTFTHALVANSPAIDAGNSVALSSSILVDQRGKPRISGNGLDIGAFEVEVAASANSTFESDGVRFVTTGGFTLTNPTTTKQVRTSGGVVQIGLVPVGGATFVPQLVLRGGVTVTSDTSAAPVLTDVTAPGDTVTVVGGNAPSGEGADKAIDNTTTGKYLNSGTVNSGFEVTPARGATVVTGLRLTTANDAVQRDPASYKLEGKNASGQFTLISEGALALPDARNAVGPTVSFSNSVAYTSYRLTFPTLKNFAIAYVLQVGEVELLRFETPRVTTFSTGGAVSALSGSRVLDLFAGIVNGDDTQRIVIPVKSLTTTGFVIDQNQANRLTISADSTFTPSRLKLPDFTDVTTPGDTVTAVGGSEGVGEGADKAIDNSTATKYVHFAKRNTGFEVTPATGATVVTALRLTTANNFSPASDPASYKLEGKNAGGQFTLIADGVLTLPDARNTGSTISFSNSVAYTTYKLTFPSIKDDTFLARTEIGEVEFLGGAVELEGVLGFTALGGAGVRVAGTDRVRLTLSGFTFAIGTGAVPFVPAGVDPNGKFTPITFTLAGLPFQADTLNATFDAATKLFEFKGRATTTFNGGSMEVEFGAAGQPGMRIENGQVSQPNTSALKALEVGNVSYAAPANSPLTLTLDQANNKATVRGRASASTSSVQLGDVGFGIGAADLVITNGVVPRFSLPLTTLKSGPFTFTNRGSDPNLFMQAEYSPDTGGYVVTGQAKMVRDGSITAISASNEQPEGRVSDSSCQCVLSHPVHPDFFQANVTLGANPTELIDVTAPDDPIVAVGKAVDGKGPALAINNTADAAATIDQTFNFPKDTGFIVTPKRGATIVQSLRLTTASDAVERDPTRYKLEGSNNPNGPFTLISEGSLRLPDERSAVGPTVSFSNSVAYTSYKLTFGDLKVYRVGDFQPQIGEFELLAISSVGTDVTAPGDPIVTFGGSGSESFAEVARAIDNTADFASIGGNSNHSDNSNSGFIVTPQLGATIVQGLRISTAEVHGFDPANYKLEGSSSPSGPFTLISEGLLALPNARRAVGPTVSFSNSVAYSSYRLTFSSIKGATRTKAVSEIELLGRSQVRGLPIVNGALDAFSIPVESFNLAANNEDPSANLNQFLFAAKPEKFPNNPLLAKFSPITQEFSISGSAGVTIPTGRRHSNKMVSGSASFGAKGTSGLVLNGQDPTKNQVSFALGDFQIAGTTFRSDSLVASYNRASKAFQYSGQATWLFMGQQLSAVPRAGDVRSSLQGFVISGALKVSGLAIQMQGYPLDFNGERPSGEGNTTISIQGKAVSAKFSAGFGDYRGENALFDPRFEFELTAPLVVGGITLEPSSLKPMLFLPNTSSNFLGNFVYTPGGKVKFQVGDVTTQASVGLPMKAKDGGLIIGGGANFHFDAITIQDIQFPDGALTATYSEADRRFTFAGQGKYKGIASVTIGGAPSNPQIIEERGVFKLTNFTPPKVDVVAGGVTFPTEGLTETKAADGIRIAFKGSRVINVGGAKITLELGGGGTKGLVLNTATGMVEEVSATITGAFTVGGVKINATGTLTYVPAENEFRITGNANITFKASTGPVSIDIKLGDKGTPGLVIKDGQVQSLQASISTNFKLFGLEVAVRDLGITYNRDRQEYGIFGSIALSTPPKGGKRVLDNFSVTLGAGPDAPGILIKNGELESIDVALNGSINLFGLTATPEHLRIVYTRAKDQLALTGGLTVSLASKFTAKAAFPGEGLLINIRTGEVQLKGLHLSVGDIKIGALGIKNLEFTYEVDDKGDTTITGAGVIGLPLGLEVAASVTIKNNRLSAIKFGVSKDPGIPVGHPPVLYLQGIEGEVTNLDDLSNFTISAKITGTVGPSVKMFGQSRALVLVTGEITISKDALVIKGDVQLVGGILGKGKGSITIFFTGKEVLKVEADVKMYPGDVIQGNLTFKLDRDFNLNLDANLGVFVPNGIPKIGGENLGTLNVHLQIRPKLPRDQSFAQFKATVLKVFDIQARINFEGLVFGHVDPPIFDKIDFKFNLPGARDLDFQIPLDNGSGELTVGEPTLAIDSVLPVVGTPGAQITFTSSSQLPDSTMIDLYVDSESSGHQGHLFASVPYQLGQQTFDWKDLAVYAAQPYDPNKPVYVYGIISDGVNLPVYTPYSAAITPPNFAPGIMLPNQQDFNAGGTLVLSTAKGNAIRITDPLATPLPDSMVEVDVRVMDGALQLANFSDRVTVTGDGTDELTLEGNVADINALLEGLTYTPLENTFFDDTLTVHVGRFPEYYSETIDATVKLKAHPLSIGMDSSFTSATPSGASGETALENAVEYIQNSGPATLLDHIVIHDMASGHIDGATITIGNFVPGQDLLDLDIMDQMDLGVHASFDAHKGVLMLTGFRSLETYQHALHTVIFESMGSGNKSLTVALGDDVNDRAEFTEAIVIKTVNQAPVVQRGNGLVYVRGGGAQSVDPTLTVSDLENAMLTGASVAFGTVNYVPAEDVLRFTDQNGITGQFDSATGVLSLSGSASAADYTAALRSVRYENLDPAPWQNHARPHDPNVDGVTSPIDALVVINDIDTTGMRKLEGSPTEFLLDVSGDGFLSPVDALIVVNFLIDATNGSASSALPTAEPESSASRVEASDVRSLTVTVTDGQAINGLGSELVRFVVLARPTTPSGPVLTILPDVVQAADDETPVILAPALTLTDADHVTLLGADVAVTRNFMAGEDVLHAVGLPDGIIGSFDELHGVLRLRGAAPASDYEYALQNITYANHATARSGDPRTISFTVRDGITTPRPVAVTVEAPAKPVVETGFGVLVYTQGRTALEVDPELVVEYFGGPTVTDAQVAFKANYLADEDRLLFTNQNGITGSFDVPTGVLNLTGTASVAHYQQALRSVQYTNTRVNPVPEYREIAFTIADGNKHSLEADFLIDVETVLQAPIITLDMTEQTFVENSAPLTIASTITITDQDTELSNGQGHRVLEGAVVRIKGYAAGEDVLTFTPQGHITGEFDAHLGDLFLVGEASLADYQAVLRSVQYQNVSEAPTETPRSIIITLEDGAHDDDAGIIPLVVQSLHNAPTRLSAAPVALTVLENAAVSLGLSEIDYAPPSDKEPSLVYTATQIPDATLGEVRLGDGVVAALNGTYSLEQLRGATFVSALNGQGTGTFTFTVAGLDPIHNAPDPSALTESVPVTVVGVVTANPGEAFVAQVYRDLLNRNPTADELTTGASQLSNGSRSDLVDSLLGSSEYLGLRIQQLYQTLLHRPAETQEVDSYVALVQQQGGTLDQVRSQIAGSFEYFENRGAGTFDIFVTALSHDLLGRDPTADERNAWVHALDEDDDLVGAADRIASSGAGTLRSANSLYQQLLRRSPDAFEQVDAARQIQSSGEVAVVAPLLTSDEYFSRYGDMNARDLDQPSEEELDALILEWLTSGAIAGNTVTGNAVRTDGFESVGVVRDAVSGHGGGTLITARHVLTAAHLVDDRDISSLRFQVGSTTYGVSRVYVHPDYDGLLLGQNGANDIAVLELNREVTDVTPSPLFHGTPQVGDELTLVGFGPRAGDPGDGQSLSVKHVGTTPVDGVTPHLLTWNFDHAGESTTVDGDSGSGEFFERDGDFYLAAIASGGTRADSSLGDHAYNTRVDAYFAWIDSVVDDEL